LKVIPVYESKKIIEMYGIPVTKMALAHTVEEAVKISKDIGFPLVMKIVSPDIVHKSDVGGVVLDVKNEEEVRKAFERIMKNVREKSPGARIEGILLEEMVKGGYEVIVGGIRDEQFGPTIMFGLGGIFVEVFKDVAFGIAPLTFEEALELIKKTKAYKILEGYRGGEKADTEKLAKTIVKVSEFLWEFREYIKELDLNPVIVSKDEVKVVDARIVLEKT